MQQQEEQRQQELEQRRQQQLAQQQRLQQIQEQARRSLDQKAVQKSDAATGEGHAESGGQGRQGRNESEGESSDSDDEEDWAATRARLKAQGGWVFAKGCIAYRNTYAHKCRHTLTRARATATTHS